MKQGSFLLLLFLMSACGSTQVETYTRLPARIKALQGKKKVEVTEFTGGLGLNTQNNLMQLIQRSTHELVNTGGDIVISGRTSDPIYSNDVKEEKQKRCVSKNKKGQCTKYVKVDVYSRSELCKINIDLFVKDNTGQTIFTKTFIGAKAKSSNWPRPKNQLEPPNRQGLCNSAFADAINDIKPFIAQYAVNMTLNIKDVSDNGNTEKAIELIQMGQFKDAEDSFAISLSHGFFAPDEKAKIRYNLASVLYAQGKYDECSAQLNQARHSMSSDWDFQKLDSLCSGRTTK